MMEQQPPILPPRPMTASLSVQQWNVVLATLDEKPHGMVRFIIDALMEQLRQQTQPAPLSASDVIDKIGAPLDREGSAVAP